MKRPPYANGIMASLLQAGHKLLLFAGPKAWEAAKFYRERGEASAAHALLLPDGEDPSGYACSFDGVKYAALNVQRVARRIEKLATTKAKNLRKVSDR